jgi:uncharacterized protein
MHVHDSIDRISPTLEPDQQVYMYQNWHHLLFLHWEIPAAELQALIPPELTIDLFEGKAYVTLVPFTVSGARPVLLPPMPGVSSFDEVNVRTYVHHKGVKPGVWFFSLDANSHIAVEAARAAYKLRYLHAKIDFSVSDAALPRIDLSCHRDDSRGPSPAHAHLRYGPVESAIGAARPGSLEHFLLERYFLYTTDDAHQLYRARVHHQPYPMQRAEIERLDETLIWASGIRRSDAIPMRQYVREVNVKVYGLEKV